MAELSTLARPYAEASFKRAKETGSVQNWSETLVFLSAIAQNQELSAIVDNPRVGKEKITELLLDICQDQIHSEAANLLKLLIENRKLKLLPTISALFEEHRAVDEGYINVNIYSAFPLTKAELSKYNAMLEKQLKKKVIAVITVDKSLLGGVLAKAGDKVIDGTIRGQIHQLAKRL